jgi:hypothetical protein
MEVLEDSSIVKFAKYFKSYKHIWTYKAEVEQYHQFFLEAPWKTIEL